MGKERNPEIATEIVRKEPNMKSLFEQMGGTYREVDGIFYPNLALPEPDPRPIGKWGRLHETYLKEHKPGTYITLLTTCKLDSYLADLNEQAVEMLDHMIEQMTKAEGVTEDLKAKSPMDWVGHMNNIRSRAEEVILADLIYV